MRYDTEFEKYIGAYNQRAVLLANPLLEIPTDGKPSVIDSERENLTGDIVIRQVSDFDNTVEQIDVLLPAAIAQLDVQLAASGENIIRFFNDIANSLSSVEVSTGQKIKVTNGAIIVESMEPELGGSE